MMMVQRYVCAQVFHQNREAFWMYRPEKSLHCKMTVSDGNADVVAKSNLRFEHVDAKISIADVLPTRFPQLFTHAV